MCAPVGHHLPSQTLKSYRHSYSNICFTFIFKWHLFDHSNHQNPIFTSIIIKRNVQSHVETESYLDGGSSSHSIWVMSSIVLLPQIFKMTYVSLWISNSTTGASEHNLGTRSSLKSSSRHWFKYWLYLVCNCVTLTSHWNLSQPWFLYLKNTDSIIWCLSFP